MDGGRRLLRSVTEAFASVAPQRPALAGFADARAETPVDPALRLPPRARRRRRFDVVGHATDIARKRGCPLALGVLFFGGVFAYGAAIGGGYERFVAENGAPQDILARAAGFGVEAITITGQKELVYGEILGASGLSDRDSLPFLDVQDVRERLMKLPLVKEASIRKLYPDRLVVEVVEREPTALWQNNGQVFLISADGKAIDALRDERFVHLPFVVGEGANVRVAEFQKIVEASGDLKSKIRAGVLVTNRRWNLKLTTGVDVKLPELQPERAIADLARLAKDQKIIDKDLIAIDLRVPGRLSARLSEEAAAVRAEANAKKPQRRGAT